MCDRLTTLAVEKQKAKVLHILSVCVCILALVIRYVMRLRHIVICGLSSSK